MMTNTKLIVQNTIVSITRIEQADFISLTDIAKVKNPNEPKDVVKNWLRTRSTIEFIGLWEKINNPNFKGVEFDSFKSEAGTNNFTLSPNLESINAELIRKGVAQTDRITALNQIAIHQMRSLLNAPEIKKLK
jgi:hypothetical protein